MRSEHGVPSLQLSDDWGTPNMCGTSASLESRELLVVFIIISIENGVHILTHRTGFVD